jgi:hypothetical protein
MAAVTTPHTGENGHGKNEEKSYLEVEKGLWSWIYTLDHKRIGVMYLIPSWSRSLGRHLRAAGAHGAADSGPHDHDRTPTTRCSRCTARSWCSCSSSRPSRAARQLLPAHHARRQGRRVPAPEPGSFYIYVLRRGVHASSASCSAAWTRAGRSTRPSSSRVSTTPSSAMTIGAFILGFSSHPHRRELHRHGPHHARARHELAPPAALHLGHLRRPRHPGARDAGARHHAAPAHHGARSSASASSTRPSAATRCSSSTSSGSTRTRPCTS